MLTFHQFVEHVEDIPRLLLVLPNLDRAATNYIFITTVKVSWCNKANDSYAYLMHMRDATKYTRLIKNVQPDGCISTYEININWIRTKWIHW